MCDIPSHLRTKHMLKVETRNISTVKKTTNLYSLVYKNRRKKKKYLHFKIFKFKQTNSPQLRHVSWLLPYQEG